MTYSIIITFYQNTNMLWNCICVLMETICSRRDVEVVVVNDNPSIDLSEKYKGKNYSVPLTVIQCQENLGHSGACNVGAFNSTGKYLIFIDCDIIVSEKWLENLEETFLRHSDCGAAMSTILDYANKQIVYAGMELYNAESIKPFRGGYPTIPYLTQDHTSQIITSGCMMIRREVFESVGGFDEKFFNSCNDLDLSMKINRLTLHNYVSAKSIVYHRGNVSGEIRFASHIYARSYFFQKWSEAIHQESKALDVLKTLYAQQNVPEGDYLIIDFSSSLFSDDYIKCLCEATRISQINRYRIRANDSIIILTDYMPWDICQMNVPILYFADDYRKLYSNEVWFSKRASKNDLIADWNGNLSGPPACD